MEAIQISSQWYVIRWENDSKKEKFCLIDGPFPEQWQAVSMARLNDIG